MIAIALGLAQVVGAGSPQEDIDTQVPQALRILDAWQDGGERAERKLHVVYWSPSDREPMPEARERLTAILEDIRNFYAAEMKRLGFGPRSIRLDYADDSLLRVHFVQGRKPYPAYAVGSGSEIRTECLPTLRAAGIDPDAETLVIFCNMSNWDPDKATISQNSPYYAGGTHRNGNAWQVDSPILNLDSLAKKEPMVRDGQYGHISVGRYNSIFIGGICHELGHALGLPHNCERADERAAFGTALMGSGNRSYGEDRRGEGRGSFLTLAHGLRLASHPMFSGSVKGIELPPNAEIEELEVEPEARTFRVSGRVSADPPPYAVIGYMDPAGGSDYDATTCTAVPDADGRFVLEAKGLVPGSGQQFRITVAQANGASSTYVGSNNRWKIPYSVAKDGTVDLSPYLDTIALQHLVTQVNADNRDGAIRELQALLAGNASSHAKDVAAALAGTLDSKPKPSPAAVEGSRVPLTACEAAGAKVGWGRPAYDRLPGPEAVVTAGGELVARSIYAHAPAEHRWELDGKWKTFEGRVGLPDSNRGGSCTFRVLGDGRELWQSKRLQAGKPTDFSVDVTGVKSLELRVDDGGDGNRSDWGMWFDPVLGR